MKKLGFLFPILFVVLFTVVTPKIFSGALSPKTVVLMAAGVMAMMALMRPKKADTKSAQTVAEELLDSFSAEAFTEDEVLAKKFYSALNDIGGNMPKSAVTKLQKLAPQCIGKKEQYAVAMATALAWKQQRNYQNAAREYNKAIVLNPNPELAFIIGDCQQRIGHLDKARDSYEFAMELDGSNPKYPSVIATTYVGDGKYSTALDYASDALAIDETYSQALATMAICYGVMGNEDLYDHYRNQAVNNGYSESKIFDTVKALKKR